MVCNVLDSRSVPKVVPCESRDISRQAIPEVNRDCLPIFELTSNKYFYSYHLGHYCVLLFVLYKLNNSKSLWNRYDREGEPSQLAAVDIFVSTVDPLKEPPLVTANTVLSILAVDYPVDKVSCYVSDDGAAMLTFEALSETSEFARKWVPFCKKYSIEPRAPEWYFAQKIDYLKDKVQPSFVKDRRAMKART